MNPRMDVVNGHGSVAPSRGAERRQLHILTTVVSGGFLWQARAIMSQLGPNYKYSLVTAPEDYRDVRACFPGRAIHVVPFPSSSALLNVRHRLRDMVASFAGCALLILRLRPDVILCVATCLAIPLFFFGRLAGSRTIFVESITRVTRLSRTGWIVLRFGLADRFYVQWPNLANICNKALYRGNVL